ncbi:acyl transferase/acyl hydrolase/lysophospholipase [Aspergillus venezuelensis]
MRRQDFHRFWSFVAFLSPSMHLYSALYALLSMLLDVALYWKERLFTWWRSKSPRAKLRHDMVIAPDFQSWEHAALQLDEHLSLDLWRQNPSSTKYDSRLIMGRLTALTRAQDEDDILTMVSLLRSGLVRNLGNITSPKLTLRANAGTKSLIDDYITRVALCIQHITALPTDPVHPSGFNSQMKVELLHDTRQAFGRTTLLLQGGSIFGLCHLGVIKALYLQGLLPRIITGTESGALMAALVGVHHEDELLDIIDNGGIDLSAFNRSENEAQPSSWFGRWVLPTSLRSNGGFMTLLRRTKRYFQKGYFLEAEVLQDCARTNLGDLTFEEAYARSKRILNITIPTTSQSGTPNLLNYLTAPNVVIWSAAVASNASNSSLYPPVTIYCKDETGSIVPWPLSEDPVYKSRRRAEYKEGESPLSRIAELFNVNHFIISQARPYIIPFLRSDTNFLETRPTSGSWNILRPTARLIALEIRHRLFQLKYLGLLPTWLTRILIEESVPGSQLTLVPDLRLGDFPKLFDKPEQATLAHWVRKGEQGVWPAVSALKVRCVIEIELDRGYQFIRRRKPLVAHSPGEEPSGSLAGSLDRSGSAASGGSVVSGELGDSAESASERSDGSSTAIQPGDGTTRQRRTPTIDLSQARATDPTITLTSPDQLYA